MKKSPIQSILHTLRRIMPLQVRKKIGPWIAFAIYWLNTRLRPNRKRPKVLSINDTLDLIKKDTLSAIRFGDGEMSLIEGRDLAFQKCDPTLATRLKEILQSNRPGLLICVLGIWERIEGFTKRSFWFTLHHLFRHGHMWKSLLSYDQTYGDAFITRPYLTYKNKSACDIIFKKIMSLWDNENIVLIEGDKSRLGIGNDLFSKAKTISRILCPSENAFSKYTEILAHAEKTPKSSLILISLGPTAKVLAYDLFMAGYRVLDIGHIDMEYEMFLRKEPGIVKVKYKYFNEIDERNPDECDDESYTKQIITRIP
jgi:glycosyltransferase family protein